MIYLDLCQMTVMGRILLLFFYKVWFFGAAFFVIGWFFLIVSFSRKKHLVLCLSFIANLGLSHKLYCQNYSCSWIEYSRIFYQTFARRWWRRWKSTIDSI